jgi:hypothetical protein
MNDFMKTRKEKTGLNNLPLGERETRDTMYPASEDIYNKLKKEEAIDPENITRLKTPNEPEMADSEDGNEAAKIIPSIDLDIPGAELDDLQEAIGSEDEENNYYSLGGDNHLNLEESTED